MNRLSLAQRAVTECGVSGTLTTTISQTGSFARIVNWVDEAWNELQTKNDDWNWMRSSVLLGAGASFATVAAQAVYPLGSVAGTVGVTAANFGKWDRSTFRCYLTSVGTTDEQEVEWVDFDQWRDGYMIGTLRSQQTRPYVAAIGPNESLCLGPPPNALYTFTADYFQSPRIMTLDADEPTGLPVQFHMAIVYEAMRSYARYESAPEVLARGEVGYNRLIDRLERNKSPQITTVGALA